MIGVTSKSAEFT